MLGQALNDYRSNAPGPASWNVAGSWQIYNGSAWGIATVPPTSSNNVTIQAGHSILMDSGSPECNNLTIELTGALNGTQPLNINGNLVVNGSITTSNAISLYGSSMSGSGTITITDAAFYFQINDNENILLSSSLILNCDVNFMKNDLTVTNNGIITDSQDATGLMQLILCYILVAT